MGLHQDSRVRRWKGDPRVHHARCESSPAQHRLAGPGREGPRFEWRPGLKTPRLALLASCSLVPGRH